jgi:hypothetical protein
MKLRQDRNDYHMTRKNSIKYKERQAILRRAQFSDQEIIMEKNKTYVKNILDPGYTVIDVRLPGHSRFVPMNVHRLRYMIHMRCIQLNPENYHVSHLCHRQAIVRRAQFSDQEIIMEKDKTYVKTFWILHFLRMITPGYIRKSQNPFKLKTEQSLNNTCI